ncbi:MULTISPECIES: mannonate dehydratase [unclassified Mesorhizobium]|uniref:mannonate dehydratase n=1 Tax=unclassified Mesorhizobium TaxID=325217 RepID=UPI000FC9F061|nr:MULTISPECIES: mannonate dehydratase [unclassified Mesorhizobium]TGP18900.1 mannonate dehydratase [Mesorhizobium sp. M1D.F.Ca.ET.231.01.1.1]TGP25610.1 mannonate dehydratase [Mesorhizobium sp. M1D.F.Ca.ET.234.01.1.1]TGS39171.1 mannonate dehydratase [Mesorhizobium sp. M1D.F.Ca.ET.184.01.1.1]TGS58581.1 mannonate dehydratase [Mesorhizobium sp. M1D.F.Ca.ET.183.01.1.1]
MEQCWRWYGPDDPVTLDHVKQAGATGVVSALHDIYDGRAWPLENILERKRIIEAAGLIWSVVESIPVHNSIKIGAPERLRYVGFYKDTIRTLAKAGIATICYNFMPVVDWTRTDLAYRLPTTGYALRFDAIDFAAYDLFVLKRGNAEASYSAARIAEAEARLKEFGDDKIDRIERNLIAGLPATERSYNRDSFREALAEYDAIGPKELRGNLAWFLREIIPVAEQEGVRMCIHPDDPPFSLYGLPRIVSTAEDARFILGAVDSPANGLTFCTGSYGARADNDIVAMVKEFASRIHFVHLRNVTIEDDGSFHEAEHLEGGTDMAHVILALMREETRRRAEGRADWRIPMRPDHGHLLADDIGKTRINPGYSLIGRLKGLAELRGIMRAVERFDLA